MIAGLILLAFATVALVGWAKLRRHGETTLPAGHWNPTDESFRDPSSGRLMRVWVDPADGTRHYVPHDGGSPR